MKKKGFTLIEMIATVVILSIISIVIVLGISSVKEKENEKKWNNTVNRITSATDVYLEKNNTIKDEIYNTGIIKYISVSEIADAGLLDEKELIDPRDEKSIFNKEDGYTEVKVYLNNNNSLEIEYPSKTSKYIIFDSKTIYAYLGETIDCLKGINVYDESNTKVSTNIIDNIKVKGDIYKVVNNEVTFDEMGEYDLVYSISENTYNRKVKVLKVEDAHYDTIGEYQYVVKATGDYLITVSGAQGQNGGKGGTISGTIHLTKGSVLDLVLGGGGASAQYGGGAGSQKGGDSSRVSLNGKFILIGAGGGGGAGGGAGGTGNGKGGANYGSGGGANGTNGSGGGMGYAHSTSCGCSTCGGNCITWLCSVGGRGFRVDDSVFTKPAPEVCSCVARESHYSCGCTTCTTPAQAGAGGSNSAQNVTVTSNIFGNKTGNGEILISYQEK